MNYKKPSDNFQDSQVWQDLLDERDQMFLADSAYELEESEAYLFKECDGENLIQYRSYRNRFSPKSRNTKLACTVE